jgi:hypothetical protein
MMAAVLAILCILIKGLMETRESGSVDAFQYREIAFHHSHKLISPTQNKKKAKQKKSRPKTRAKKEIRCGTLKATQLPHADSYGLVLAEAMRLKSAPFASNSPFLNALFFATTQRKNRK